MLDKALNKALDSNIQSDEYVFAQEDEEIQSAAETRDRLERSWKILVVDDEVEVHEVTKLALSDFVFETRSLTFISAYSAEEAKQMMQTHPDVAIIFLDVVMETEDAGLKIIRHIREELNNSIVRIILRTGQPGQAPETVVAIDYGINDYKLKTELTSKKLYISVITALRAFSMLMQMLETSQQLELELAKYKQVEASLRVSEMQEREKVRQLERSFQVLQQTHLQPEQREKIETLGQLVTEVTHDLICSANAGSLYTLSMITRIARMVLRIIDEHSAKLGLSQSKLAVLIYLSGETEQSGSPSVLAKYCGVSRAAMTGLLDGLEQEGYVERDDHPFDRRALMVRLTEKGKHFLDWITPQDQHPISQLIAALDDAERGQLIETGLKILKLFEQSTN